MANDSNAFSMEELERNPETVMRLTGCVTCSEHHGEDIKYYCKDHNVPCCGACYSEHHKTCSNVIDLKKELPVLLCNSKPDEIIAQLKQIEIHLMKFMTLSPVDTVGPQINTSTDQIREVRKKINDVLDEIETHVMAEGSRVYNAVAIKKQNENHQCLSLFYAVRTSQNILEVVHQHGSNLQKFLMAERMRVRLRSYINLVGEKYEKIETVSAKAELSYTIQSILSISVSELGKVVSTVGYIPLPLTGSQNQTKNCQVQESHVTTVRVPTVKKPMYTDIAFLSGDMLMLVDNSNNQCILVNSSYRLIERYTLTDIPLNVCVLLDDQAVAVSCTGHTPNILILSVVGDVIRPVRTIPTKYTCSGIAYAGKGEMVVNWYCGGNLKSEWSLINTRGEVMHSHPYDCPCSQDRMFSNYVALNNAKTRVYISANAIDSILCFDMYGNSLFTYKPGNLLFPRGVAVDRYDNIYVIGQRSKNIHQLSPNGNVLQVIPLKASTSFCAISIHESEDIVVANSINRAKLHFFKLT